MRSTIIIRWVLYLLLFLLPPLGMNNCQGWNESSVSVSSCTVDGVLFRSYANAYEYFSALSAVMLHLPWLIYGILSLLLV